MGSSCTLVRGPPPGNSVVPGSRGFLAPRDSCLRPPGAALRHWSQRRASKVKPGLSVWGAINENTDAIWGNDEKIKVASSPWHWRALTGQEETAGPSGGEEGCLANARHAAFLSNGHAGLGDNEHILLLTLTAGRQGGREAASGRDGRRRRWRYYRYHRH